MLSNNEQEAVCVFRLPVIAFPVIAGDGDSGSYGNVADTAMNLFCVLGFFVWWI